MGYVFTNNDLKARLLKPLVHRLMQFTFSGREGRLVLLNQDDLAFFKASKLIDPNLIRMLPGAGIDCRRFKPRANSSQNTKFRVLLPARMLWDKGVSEYVDAARILRSEGREIEFLLAGAPDPGNPAAVPEQMIHSWVKEGVVNWLGHVDEMPSLFNSVDVVVLPSYREGLPTGLTEAGACALPLVTTDVPGCREVVVHDVDGLLVPVKDALALAKALARLQDDPSLCKRLGAAARTKALKEFDEIIVTERTLAIYDELYSALYSINKNVA
jgi:glycosyltransferase involved in cell wall biosynthesis